MLSSVVDQCLTLALASASRHVSRKREIAIGRTRPWNKSLAAYPRLAAALDKAAADGVLLPRGVRSVH
jgi:hypothetical protein